jgi:hypothetical protein
MDSWSFGEALRDTIVLREAVHKAVREVREAVCEAVRDAVCGAVHEAFGEAFGEVVCGLRSDRADFSLAIAPATRAAFSSRSSADMC